MVSLLWKACQEGDSARVEELLADSSQDVDVKDHTGVTPLILAAKGGHSTILQALLNRGADPNGSSTQGRPETYTTDPYILHLLAVARGDVAAYPEPAMHPQYYSYPQYYQYVQDPWYLHHHPQQPAQQEDHQSDPADSTSNTPPTTNNASGNASMMSTNPSSHPSLPPPEVARNIPCRYFPACRYGSSCVFLHPTTPYFSGSLPPPAQYPHMYYPPLAFAPQGTAATAGINTASHDTNDTSAQAQQFSSSDQNGVVENTQNTASVGAQSESGISVSGEASGEGGTGGRVRSPSASVPTSTSMYAHPAMVYMYPAMHPPPPPPHSQDGHHPVPPLPPPPPHHYSHYPPPPPLGTVPPHPHSHSVTQPHSLPTHQHILPPPTLSHENAMQPEQQHQPPQPLPDVQGQPQPPTGPQVHPPHVIPYPQPPQIYPSPLHSTTHAPWSHMPHPQPPPPPPHHHHHHPSHPHHHMHPTAPIPPPHPALTAIPPPVSSMPAPGTLMSVPSGPGAVPPPSNGLGPFASRGGRGGRRGGAAFRGGDRDRDRERSDRDRGDRDRFGINQNGHYHHNGPHHPKKQLCLFFPNGKCRNGEDCRFSHVLPDPNGTVPNGNGSPLSPNAPLSNHRHSQSFSYRRPNYMNGHSLHTNNVNGDDEAHLSSIASAGTGPSTNAGAAGTATDAGATSSVAGVDEILNAMTLNTPDRRQIAGGRRGKHQGQGGGGGGYGHAHSYSHGGGGGGGHSQSLSVSPSRGQPQQHHQQQQQQQQQQRVPTAADFPVLGNGSSVNGAGSSTETSATGRTTPVHPISSAASNAGGAATTATSTPGSAVSPPITATAPTSSWSTGGTSRLTAAQVVKEGMTNGHGHLGAWGKAPPPPPSSSANVEKEKVLKEKEKEKDVKERERTVVKEVKVSA